LLHGGSGSWKHWIRTIPALLAEHTVWVPDLPGFGESELPSGAPSFETLSALLGRAAVQVLGSEPYVDLVGFSLGAAVAICTVRAFEGRVRHLALIGSNFTTEPLGEPALVSLRGIEDPRQRVAAYRANLRALMLASDESIDELALYIYTLDSTRRRMPGVALSSRDQLLRALPGLGVHGNVLALSGSADVITAHVADRQAAALERLRPGARYAEIAGAGHWAMYERPAAVNAELARALAP